MKIITLFYPLVILFLFKSIDTNEIRYVIDAWANGTATFIELPFELEDYIYLGFDFDYHNQISPENKEIAFFRMESNVDLFKSNSVRYLLSEKYLNETEIIDIKDLNWKEIKYSSKQAVGDNSEYYYKIERTDKKYKTLYLRVANINSKQGTLIVENINKENFVNDEKDLNENNSIARTIQLSKLIWLFILLFNLC